MQAKKKRSHEFAIGLFISLGLLLLITTVFLIGRQRRIFESTAKIETHFSNVSGLSVGADVLLSGVLVGNVAAIKFPNFNNGSPEVARDITVVLKVSRRSLDLIRTDSVVKIDTKGLLGDKIINISMGSPDLPGISDNAVLKSTTTADFSKAIQQAQEIMGNLNETLTDARGILKGFVAQGGDVALTDAAKSLGRIFKEIEEGNGVFHELIYDKKSGHHTKESLASLGSLTRSLNEASLDIQSIVTDVKEGKGSLGLLLRDPSLYNELYGILGNLNRNLERNSLLKAVVRYGISNQAKKAEVPNKK